VTDNGVSDFIKVAPF